MDKRCDQKVGLLTLLTVCRSLSSGPKRHAEIPVLYAKRPLGFSLGFFLDWSHPTRRR